METAKRYKSMDETTTERRMATIEQNREILAELKTVKDMVATINSVLIGEVRDDKPGLLERVRKIEQWIDNEKKLIYSISFIIFADVVMRIWTVITK
jgi:hypothetical protein